MAREKALGLLNEHLTEAVACLTSMATQLDHVDTSEELADTLAECGNTTPLNMDADQLKEEELGPGANVIYSGSVVGDRIVLHVMTTGTAHAQAGVANDRVYLATCWQVTVDRGAQLLTDYAASLCNDALLLLNSPSTEQVPFSDLQVPEV